MNENEHSEESGKYKVSLARARELLGDNTISDEELEKVLQNLWEYCGIVYDVYKKVKRDKDTDKYKEDAENGEEKEGFDYKDAA